ncbi:hypothetical protein [Haloarchaeobius sp. DFWS5]|uniref:hypothetical protein n=1 Tax=Haloarchaeobius sp. DFWS5 TaxID=3446114 RepID=UPI003EB77919
MVDVAAVGFFLLIAVAWQRRVLQFYRDGRISVRSLSLFTVLTVVFLASTGELFLHSSAAGYPPSAFVLNGCLFLMAVVDVAARNGRF